MITLPQHVEPFLVRDNEAVTVVLSISDRRYSDASLEESFTNVLLRILARNTCDVYVEQIQSLREINDLAAQQLAADIGKSFVNKFNSLIDYTLIIEY